MNEIVLDIIIKYFNLIVLPIQELKEDQYNTFITF